METIRVGQGKEKRLEQGRYSGKTTGGSGTRNPDEIKEKIL